MPAHRWLKDAKSSVHAFMRMHGSVHPIFKQVYAHDVRVRHVRALASSSRESQGIGLDAMVDVACLAEAVVLSRLNQPWLGVSPPSAYAHREDVSALESMWGTNSDPRDQCART